MLDIDWHGDSYRSVPQMFHQPDSLHPLMKFDGGDAGWVLLWASASLASLLQLKIRKLTLLVVARR